MIHLNAASAKLDYRNVGRVVLAVAVRHPETKETSIGLLIRALLAVAGLLAGVLVAHDAPNFGIEGMAGLAVIVVLVFGLVLLWRR